MNRILIVGHSASGYQTVESVLQQRGMCSPRPSRREELLPQEITSTLCKVHKTPHIEHMTAEDDIEQLQVAPIWHGMAMDLMLGNLEQELWGWADPQAIYTLDYWAQLDDQLTFVLVYDKPQSALVNAATKLDNLPAPDLEQQLSNWMVYNGALLHFFLRHTDRCLLVNAQQVRHNTDGCLQKLQPLLRAPLLSLTEDETVDGVTTDGTQLSAYPIHTMIPAQKLTDVINLAGLKTTKAHEILQGSAMESYLLNQVLAEYPACLALYAELQSAASLPLQEPHQASNNAAQAWGALVQQRTLTIELASGLHEAYQGLSLNLEQTVAEQARESALRLSQLHQVQEELESHYLQKQVLEQHSAAQSREIQYQAELVKHKEAEKSALNKALHETQQLLQSTKSAGQQKLGEHVVQLKTLGNENDLLLSQLYRVQEELERSYLDNQHLKKQLPVPMYGAADRVKQELGYRLGSVMIKRSRSLTGWLGMPWALRAEIRAFRLQCEDHTVLDLPPIRTYCDAHEAERIKSHLSHRLGQTLIKNGKSPLGWVKLPFALGQDVRQFRLQRRGT
ncbi:hypothetical protein ACK354_02605 [Aeromonas veronii]